MAAMSSASSTLNNFVQGHRWDILSTSDMNVVPSAIPAAMMTAGPWSWLSIRPLEVGAEGFTLVVMRVATAASGEMLRERTGLDSGPRRRKPRGAVDYRMSYGHGHRTVGSRRARSSARVVTRALASRACKREITSQGAGTESFTTQGLPLVVVYLRDGSPIQRVGEGCTRSSRYC